MKKLFFLIATCMMMGCAVAPTASLKAEKVIEMPGVSKDDLFIRANEWATKQFRFPESVIEYSDKDAGTIMGKYTTDYSMKGHATRTLQTMIIEIKDEKVRITIEDPWYRYIANPSYRKQVLADRALTLVKKRWDETIISFEETLKNATTTRKNEW
ncbi:MAG: DUF4468 domain-containing protein [Prevotellaceae bacterium]|nr:DUF4468 domain-containing protein [Prevotellaceae bacterium]